MASKANPQFAEEAAVLGNTVCQTCSENGKDQEFMHCVCDRKVDRNKLRSVQGLR